MLLTIAALGQHSVLRTTHRRARPHEAGWSAFCIVFHTRTLSRVRVLRLERHLGDGAETAQLRCLPKSPHIGTPLDCFTSVEITDAMLSCLSICVKSEKGLGMPLPIFTIHLPPMSTFDSPRGGKHSYDESNMRRMAGGQAVFRVAGNPRRRPSDRPVPDYWESHSSPAPQIHSVTLGVPEGARAR